MGPHFTTKKTEFFPPIYRFSVKLWQATSVHGHEIASQSGCKLIAYTTTGMAHAVSTYFRFCLKFTKKNPLWYPFELFFFYTYLQISYLLLALVIYAYKGMNAADFRYIFKPKIRNFRYGIISAVCLQFQLP